MVAIPKADMSNMAHKCPTLTNKEHFERCAKFWFIVFGSVTMAFFIFLVYLLISAILI
jgi:hypothetical protein